MKPKTKTWLAVLIGAVATITAFALYFHGTIEFGVVMAVWIVSLLAPAIVAFFNGQIKY